MALELVGAMSNNERRLPADMLLLRERQRRLQSARNVGDAADHRPATPEAAYGEKPAGEEMLLEGDSIVVEPARAVSPDVPKSGVGLYRPLAYVSLGGMAWSGTVDHEALQAAVVCAPVRGSAGDERPPQWLAAVTTLALSAVPKDEPALHAQLGADDIVILSRIGTRLSREAAMRLVRASALPSTIVGADSATTGAAGAVLAAYRHAALVFAWQSALCGNAAGDATRERDASAVQLMSILRALLGEI
jgi:hypothetical protein